MKSVIENKKKKNQLLKKKKKKKKKKKNFTLNKHTCFPRTYPGIMYSTDLVITKSNFIH